MDTLEISLVWIPRFKISTDLDLVAMIKIFDIFQGIYLKNFVPVPPIPSSKTQDPQLQLLIVIYCSTLCVSGLKQMNVYMKRMCNNMR